MEHLRIFETETEYNENLMSLDYPTVSYIEELDKYVYFDESYYSQQYLTFVALENGTFTLTIPENITPAYMESVSYSTDNGETWTTTNNTYSRITVTTPTIEAGNTVLWKGVGKQFTNSSNYSWFESTGNFNVCGNIMSLFYEDDFQNQTSFIDSSEYNFRYLFYNATKLINTKNLILPATTLKQYCYSQMFEGCTSLVTAPELPATILADDCYSQMFRECENLIIAPELPATTLATNCYYQMFYNCLALTTAPNLPATTLAQFCYYQMFFQCVTMEYNIPTILPATTLVYACYEEMFCACRKMTTAPILPALTLVDHCYSQMFTGCCELNYIKAMFTTTPSSAYCQNWVLSVSETGTFVKNSAASWDVTGDNGIPSGWTVKTADE